MFRPVKMALAQIYMLRSELPRVTTTLMSEGVLHLERADCFARKLPGVRAADPGHRVEEIDGLLGQLEELARRLGIPWVSRSTLNSCPHLDPENVVEEARRRVGELSDRIDSSIAEIDNEELAINNLELLSTQIQSLGELGIRGGLSTEHAFIHFDVGTVPTANVTTLQRSLESVPHQLEISRQVAGNVLVNVVTTAKHAEAVEGALRGSHFSRLRIPPKYMRATNAVEEIEVDLWQRREHLSSLKEELAKLRDDLRDDVSLWRRTLLANRSVLSSMANFLQTDYSYYITGWVPLGEAEALKRELCGGNSRGVEVEYAAAEKVLSQQQVEVEVPTKLSHPAWMRPFQNLVNLYGWPKYDGLDPTLFLMLTFTPLFGMMFGDVGHGLVLAMAGLGLLKAGRKSEQMASAAGILLWCGLSGTAFGVLYGSVFGMEELVPALWIRPLDDPGSLIRVGVIVGIVCVTLGLVLNIVQAAKRRAWQEMLFGQWGLLSLVFYYSALPIAWAVVTSGKAPFGMTMAALLLVLPILGMVVGNALATRFAKRKEDEPEGILEFVFKPMETMIGLLTNTVSFVRAAAFGLGHASLLPAVYITADALGGVVGVRETNIVLGNILVIGLEGLIVFIQCMRLEFYEFFSKFFLDQGRRYEPLCLPR